MSDKIRNFHDLLVSNNLVGQKVGFVCTRYHYRGILAQVFEDCLVLTNACVVSDFDANNKILYETPLKKHIWIHFSSIELYVQEDWVNSPLPSTHFN